MAGAGVFRHHHLCPAAVTAAMICAASAPGVASPGPVGEPAALPRTTLARTGHVAVVKGRNAEALLPLLLPSAVAYSAAVPSSSDGAASGRRWGERFREVSGTAPAGEAFPELALQPAVGPGGIALYGALVWRFAGIGNRKLVPSAGSAGATECGKCRLGRTSSQHVHRQSGMLFSTGWSAASTSIAQDDIYFSGNASKHLRDSGLVV